MTDLNCNNQAIVQAFLATWELFPEPVCLINRKRDILASNALARQTGRVTGTKCFSFNKDANGKNTCTGTCMANEALDQREARIRKDQINGLEIASYWVPVPELEDCFVHFAIGVKALMEAAAQA
jgi:hypothetical protein